MKYIFKYILFGLLFFPGLVSAHEAYVLPHSQFELGLKQISLHAFAALRDPGNIRFCLLVTAGISLALILNFLFAQTKLASEITRRLEAFSRFGPWIVRITVSVALFFSAYTNSFLGPEIGLNTLPYGVVLRGALFLISGMILLGFFTELAAAAAMVIFIVAGFVYHWYLATYLNYFGELVVLILFGTRIWSLDRLMFGLSRSFTKISQYETTIVRICYGLALIYAGINIKLLHPSLTVDVVNDYNLTQFHWLFPHDALLVTLGAGLTEFTMGLFIVLGFQLRLSVLVSLFYITLSLLYFREAVWPHLLLYGISINLLITPQQLSLDNYLSRLWARHRP